MNKTTCSRVFEASRYLLCACGVLMSGLAVAQERSSPPAEAAGAAGDSSPFFLTPRLRVLSGQYEVSTSRAVDNGFDPVARIQSDADTGYYGLGTSLILSRGKWFGDATVEYLDIDLSDVTEGTARLGYYVSRGLFVNGGYRAAFQGDGFGSDDAYRERGGFVGLGYVVPRLAFLPASIFGAVGVSANYNNSTFELPSGREPDADGFLATLSIGIARMPLSLGLRYRRFEVNDRFRSGQFDIDEDLEEDYFSVHLEYSFQALSL